MADLELDETGDWDAGSGGGCRGSGSLMRSKSSKWLHVRPVSRPSSPITSCVKLHYQSESCYWITTYRKHKVLTIRNQYLWMCCALNKDLFEIPVCCDLDEMEPIFWGSGLSSGTHV